MTGKIIAALDGKGKAGDNRWAEFNSSDEIGVSNKKAGEPLRSGIFMPVHTTVAPSMVGRGGGYFGSVGLLFFRYANPATFLPPSIGVEMWEFNSLKKGAYIMPKLARTFLTYSLVVIITLAIERSTPILVIALAIAALVLLQVIGGADHA